jgi:hypothetical protein
MNGNHSPVLREQGLVGLCLLVVGVWVAYEIGGKIATNDFGTLEYATLGFAGLGVAVTILRRWRTGLSFQTGDPKDLAR